MSRAAVTTLVLLCAATSVRAQEFETWQAEPVVIDLADDGASVEMGDEADVLAQVAEPNLHLACWQPEAGPFVNDPVGSASADVGEVFPAGPCFWIRGEYLHWWTKANDLPPLVTTSPAGTPRANAGVLGQFGTEIISDATTDDEYRSGFRVSFGRVLESGGDYGLDATWFSVFDDDRTGDLLFASGGDLTLARPFFDVQSNQQVAELLAYTDPSNVLIAEGSVDIRSSSEMHSGSLLLRSVYRSGTRGQVDLIGGYRYFRFREGLLIREHVIARDPGGVVAVGTTFDLTDRFVTENNFHGGELGLIATFYHGPVDVELLAKVAFGSLDRVVRIDGETVVTAPPPSGAQSTSPGGLLTQPTNMGRHSDNEFAVLPEFGLNLRLPIGERVTFNAGYSLVLLNHVARTGEQIDLGLNPSQFGGDPLVGPARPAPQMADSDFWAQGLNVGLVIEH